MGEILYHKYAKWEVHLKKCYRGNSEGLQRMRTQRPLFRHWLRASRQEPWPLGGWGSHDPPPIGGPPQVHPAHRPNAITES